MQPGRCLRSASHSACALRASCGLTRPSMCSWMRPSSRAEWARPVGEERVGFGWGIHSCTERQPEFPISHAQAQAIRHREASAETCQYQTCFLPAEREAMQPPLPMAPSLWSTARVSGPASTHLRQPKFGKVSCNQTPLQTKQPGRCYLIITSMCHAGMAPASSSPSSHPPEAQPRGHHLGHAIQGHHLAGLPRPH